MRSGKLRENLTKNKESNALTKSSSLPLIKRFNKERRFSIPLSETLNIDTSHSMVSTASSPFTPTVTFGSFEGEVKGILKKSEKTPELLAYIEFSNPIEIVNAVWGLTINTNCSPRRRKKRGSNGKTSTPTESPNSHLSVSQGTSSNVIRRLSETPPSNRPKSRRTSTNTSLPVELVRDPLEMAKQGFAPIRCEPKMTGAFKTVDLTHWMNSGVKCLRVMNKSTEDLKPYVCFSLMEEKDNVAFLSLAKKIEFETLSASELNLLKDEQKKMFFENLKGAIAQSDNKVGNLLLEQEQSFDADGAYVVVLTKEGPMAFIGKGNHALLASMSPYVIAAGDIYFVTEPDGRLKMHLNASSGGYHHDTKEEYYLGGDGSKINYVESAKKAIAATFGDNVVYIKGDKPIHKNLPLPKVSSQSFLKIHDKVSSPTQYPESSSLKFTIIYAKSFGIHAGDG